jgi:hypothetical protein
MLVRKGLRKGKCEGCQFFIQVQPYTPAGKVASGAGGRNVLLDSIAGPLLCDRGTTRDGRCGQCQKV